MSRFDLTRRGLLGLAGGALAYGAVRTFAPLAKAFAAASNDRLLVVHANGGIRCLDFCDAYDDSAGVEKQYTDTERTLVTGDWYLPDTSLSLESAGTMALVRHVDMETASHDIGSRIGLTGSSRTDQPAGSVIVGNDTTYAGDYLVPGLSFARAMTADETRTGPVAGEPADLVELFTATPPTGDTAVDAAIAARLSTHNALKQNAYRKQSPFHDYVAAHQIAEAIVNDGSFATALASIGDPGTSGDLAYDYKTAGTGGWSDENALRFAGAEVVLDSDLVSVASITVTGFDTHADLQDDLCAELATLLGTLMSRIDMARTTVIVTSDFDRTPEYNGSGGTDHWTRGSVLLMGNGIKDWVTDDQDSYPGSIASTYKRQDIWATVFEIFGLAHEDYFRGAQIISDVRQY